MPSEDSKQREASASLPLRLDVVVILWRLWTLPKSVLEAIQYPDQKKTEAAVLDLALIAFLLFVIHGMAEHWAVALALAAVLSTAVNYFSKMLKIKLSQNVWISGYSTVAVTMLFTIVVQSIFQRDYKEWVIWVLNPYSFNRALLIVPVLIATVPTIVLWLLKAFVFDRNKVTSEALAYAGSVTVGGAAVVIVLSLISDPVIAALLDYLPH